MHKLLEFLSVTGIQRPEPSRKSPVAAGARSDDCPAPGDGDDDGGGSDCPAGV